jgi:hypothetical protein
LRRRNPASLNLIVRRHFMPMRIAPIVASSLLVLCGCSGREQPELKPLAQSLANIWPRANQHLELTMRATEINGKVILHGILKNSSATALTLNRSRLPWTSPAWLSVDAVTVNAEMPRSPPPAVISVLEGASSQIVLQPGDILEGDIDLASGPLIPIGKLPRDIDVLLLWSYSLDISTPGENPFFSGIAFLERRS